MKLKNLFTLLFLFIGMVTISAQLECDCPEPDWGGEGICFEFVEDGETVVGYAPSECFVTCWIGEDYEVVECDDLEWDDDWDWGDDWEWDDDCECSEDDWNDEGICIEFENDGETYTEWAPSECFAECWYGEEIEFTVIECDDWGWGDDCECSEDDWNDEGICIELIYEGETYTEWAPSECYAECWYGEELEYAIVECDDWEWEDECECSDEDWNDEGICIALDYEGVTYIEWAPSECLAECWYGEELEYTVVDCAEGGFDYEGGQCNWGEDCDCDIDSDEGICIAYVYSDSTFGVIDTLIEWVPNECVADCWGFTDYAVVDCESLWDWEEDSETIGFEGEEAECVIALMESEEITFQAFLIGFSECIGLELDECVLNAPTFESDEEFIEYLLQNCPEWFGFAMDESDGPSLFRAYQDVQEAGVTSTKEITGLEFRLLGNPVVDQLNVSLSSAEALNLQITVTSNTGKVLNVDQLRIAQGEQIYELNTTRFPAGIYNMVLSEEKATQTLKFIVIK